MSIIFHSVHTVVTMLSGSPEHEREWDSANHKEEVVWKQHKKNQNAYTRSKPVTKIESFHCL